MNPLTGAIGAAALAVLGLRAQRFYSPEVPLGFRVEGPAAQTRHWRSGTQRVTTSWRDTDPIRLAVIIGEDEPIDVALRVVDADGDRVILDVDGVYVHAGDRESMLIAEPRLPSPQGIEDEPGSCTAPTPGTVTAVFVAPGDTVEAGAKLVTLEAMKMEHEVTAPDGGVVIEVRVAVGDTVEKSDLLVQLAAEAE